MNETGPQSHVPARLWWSVVGLLVLILIVGLGFMAALALGWRSPTPRRAPDWILSGMTWQKFGVGSWTVSADRYRVRLSQPYQRAWLVADQAVVDFELELVTQSMLASADVGVGLVCRYQDPDNYYLFAVGGDGYYTIAIVDEGKLVPLREWQQFPHVRRGAATNRLRVRCVEALCQFHINDEFTVEISDDTFAAGKVGLWAETFSDDGLDVAFERVRLWSLD